MSDSANLNLFIQKILNITVQRMGGASAGILGSSGADNDIVNNLKKTVIAYANEYTKTTPSRVELVSLSQYIYGYLQTLQLTYTLTATEADKLINDLQELTDMFSA